MGKVCEKCNHENSEGAIYCESCNEMLNVLGGSSKKNGDAAPVEKEVYEPPKPKEEEPKKKKSGCLLLGCIGLLLVVGIIAAIPVTAYFYADDYLTTSPISITPRKSSASDQKRVSAKIEKFTNGDTKVISLSASELNTLVASNDDLKSFFYFHLNKDLLRIKANLPVPILGEKYLSARIDVKASGRDENVSINVTNILLEKGALSPDLIEAIREINFFDLLKENNSSSSIELKSVEIKNDRLQIISK